MKSLRANYLYLVLFVAVTLATQFHVSYMNGNISSPPLTIQCEHQNTKTARLPSDNSAAYLMNCNHRCNRRQSCFLGKCYCLPGHAGPDCTTRRILDQLTEPSHCPVYTSKAMVRNQTTFEYPVKHCLGIPKWARTRPSCAIFCNWQADAGIVSVSPHIWEQQEEINHVAHEEYLVVAEPDQIPEAQTRWAEYTEGFDSFRSLPPDRNLGQYLEVGAGLYTQLYNVVRHRPDVTPEAIYLAEPDIFRYVTMPQCLYRNSTLLGQRVHLLSITTEDLGMVGFFDTVLVINVLEHVIDAFEFLTQIYASLKTGGTLIFAERYFDHPAEPSSKVLHSAMQHPIRVRRGVLQHLFRLFDTIYIKDFTTTKSRQRKNGETGYYFIGRKRGVPTDGEPNATDLDRLFPPQKIARKHRVAFPAPQKSTRNHRAYPPKKSNA